MLHAASLLHGLQGLALAHPIYLYQRIGSTNDEAVQMARSGAPEGLLIVAEEQTSGRGRAGRTWLTPPGQALAVSLLLRPSLPAAGAARLTMLAGLAICEALEQAAPVRAALKWPNDVLIRGRKVAGILLETAVKGEQLDYAVLGIGVNVSWAPAPEAVSFPATQLESEAGQPVDRLRLLRTILSRLEAHYADLASDQLYQGWRDRLALMGSAVTVQAPDGEHAGVAEAVDAEGALILRLESGQALRVLAGDVHLRPAA